MVRTSHAALFRLICWFIPPVVFLVVPMAAVEAGPSLCLFRNIWGIHCPGCGMTRALSCIFHAHFRQAFQYNYLVVLVFPLLVYGWWRGISRGFTRWRNLAEYEHRVSL